MSENTPDLRLWAAGVLFAGLAGFHWLHVTQKQQCREPRACCRETRQAGPNQDRGKFAQPDNSVDNSDGKSGQNPKPVFSPPSEDEIPKNDFGDMVRLGEKIFHDTQGNAKEFVGNSLVCSNCHLDSGRLANAAPLWAAYVLYPAYRAKNGHVNSFQERLQGCFLYSMNGKAPAADDKVLVALESYAYFLARGARPACNCRDGVIQNWQSPPSSTTATANKCMQPSARFATGPMAWDKVRQIVRLFSRHCGAPARSTGARV